MRRWWAWGVAGAVALALSGCGKPAGVDGDLTNAWPAFEKAKTPVPVVGACYPDEYDSTWHGDFDSAVDCKVASHQTETVYVGTFTAADADRSAPPLAGSSSRKAAYSQCQKAATEYLGGEWQSGKVFLGLVLPDDKAWAGGARWYRCDVTAFKDSNLDIVATTGSVKDGLRGSRPLGLTCLIVTDDGKNSLTKTEDADCAQPHNGEFAGIYAAPDGPYQANQETRRKLANTGCESIVAHFLGFPGDQALSRYIGWMALGFDEDQWNLGDRTERCYALAFNGNTVNGARVVGSVKGIKDGAPKKP